MVASFFSTLKTEFYYRRVWPTKTGAKLAVADTPRSTKSAPSRSRCNTATTPRQIDKPHNPVSTNRGQGQARMFERDGGRRVHRFARLTGA